VAAEVEWLVDTIPQREDDAVAFLGFNTEITPGFCDRRRAPHRIAIAPQLFGGGPTESGQFCAIWFSFEPTPITDPSNFARRSLV